MSGRLTFIDAPQFTRFLGEALVPNVTVCDIDLGGLEYIDSTGMSLFVHVYDAAKANGQRVTLRNTQGTVRDTLQRAGFDTLFEFK